MASKRNRPTIAARSTRKPRVAKPKSGRVKKVDPATRTDDIEIDESGVEKTDEGEGVITTPYDPAKTNIITKTQSIDTLVKRIEYGEIDMAPEFQRRAGLWSPTQMSRLIESCLIRIPLPAFYFDGTDDKKWITVDGLQRLTTFQRFLLPREGEGERLTGLEYLTDYEGKRVGELPRDLRRRIEETNVTLHIIQPGTPQKVTYNIFKRINTGGLVLKPQEIRHAINPGPAIELLARLATSDEFLRATDHSVSPKRMTDQEMVLRFLAFTITHYTTYSGNLERFLDDQLEHLDEMKDRHEQLARQFRQAMTAAHRIFGKNAFRKSSPGRRVINKALFEAWSVVLGGLAEKDVVKLVERRDALRAAFAEKLAEDSAFYNSITAATGDAPKVALRFATVESLVQQILGKPR